MEAFGRQYHLLQYIGACKPITQNYFKNLSHSHSLYVELLSLRDSHVADDIAGLTERTRYVNIARVGLILKRPVLTIQGQ